MPVAPSRRRRFGTANPFLLPDVAKQVSDLLLTTEVISIHFAFGSVLIMPEGFRAVSQALIGPSATLGVAINPTELEGSGSNASYDAGDNRFTFRSYYFMSTPDGRGDAVHEATHAIADYRKRSTSIRSEEGAAYVAEAWYHLNAGTTPGDMPARVLEIAAAVRSRAHGGPVEMYGSEINAVRGEMKKRGYAEKGEDQFYSNDGI